jgi:hypothetical protein
MMRRTGILIALITAVLLASTAPAQSQSGAQPLTPNIGTTFPKKTFPTFRWTAVPNAGAYQLRVIDDADILLLDMFVSPTACSGGVCTVNSPIWFKRVGNYRWRVITLFDGGASTKGPLEYFHVYPAYAVQMLARVNALRCSLGRTPVALNVKLFLAAQRHSTDLALTNRVSHTGSDGSTASMRIAQSGYSASYIGENVAAGYPTADLTFEQWVGSSGHYDNMVNPIFREMGVALATNPASLYRHYWTQDFGNGNSGIPGRCP